MKLRSLCLFVVLFALAICASVHVALTVGLAAGLASYVVLDVSLTMLGGGLFGCRQKGILFVTTNSLGTLAATGVFHDALGLLLKRLPFLKRIASDIQPAMGSFMMPFGIAQTLKNYNASQTVSFRDATGTYAKQAGVSAATDQTFTLNRWPYISIQLTLAELNSMVDSATNASARNTVIEKLMVLAFNTLGTQIVNDLYAVVTAGNYALSQINAVGNMDWKHLGTITDTFLQNDAQASPLDALLEIVCYRELANSLTNVPNASYDINGIIETGIIQEPLSGCQSIARYNLTQPADASRGFIIGPEGVVFANRVPMEEQIPNDPVFQTILTDPATGFSVLLREAKDPLTGEVTRTLTTLYGFAVGLAKRIVRITPS